MEGRQLVSSLFNPLNFNTMKVAIQLSHHERSCVTEYDYNIWTVASNQYIALELLTRLWHNDLEPIYDSFIEYIEQEPRCKKQSLVKNINDFKMFKYRGEYKGLIEFLYFLPVDKYFGLQDFLKICKAKFIKDVCGFIPHVNFNELCGHRYYS